MDRRRTALALSVAASVHVAVAGLLPHAGRESRAKLPAAVEGPSSIDLEVETPAPPVTIPSNARGETVPGATAVPHGNQRLALAMRRATEQAGVDDGREDADTASLAETSAPRGTSTWTFPTTRPNLALGEHTGALARASGIGLPSQGEKLDGPLLLSADGIDAANGRARSGPLREAVDDVARRAEAPMEGVAVFEITVGPEHPAKARLVEASSNYGGWSGLTEAIDTATRKKVLRLPPDGRALRVVVRVEAAMKLVDGRREKDLGVKTSATGVGVRDNASSGESSVVLPTASLHLRGKVCSITFTGGFTASPISGGCSLETIGTRAARRVTTSLVSEERVSIATP